MAIFSGIKYYCVMIILLNDDHAILMFTTSSFVIDNPQHISFRNRTVFVNSDHAVK